MITGKTSSGFEYSVDANIGNDFRFVQKLRKLMSNDMTSQVEGVVDLVHTVFNDEAQEEAFLLHLADDRGRVPADKVFDEVKEILDASAVQDKDVKN